MSKAIVWFRNDLRIRDNEVLATAMSRHDEVYCIYCLNPHDFGLLKVGEPKIGPFRAQFLLETLADLKGAMQGLGGDLAIIVGNPEKEIFRLAVSLSVDNVYAEKAAIAPEVVLENNLENVLWQKGISLELLWQSTLYHVHDIPWPIKHLPKVFTDFRKELVASTEVRPLSDVSSGWDSLRSAGPSELPTLKMLGLDEPHPDSRSVLQFKGGEGQAWKRLNHYFWESDLLSKYKLTRNGLIGPDYSSKLSPWLALGAISPKSIYYEILRYEQERTKNESTYWLYFELLWRDYFRFNAKKHGGQLFDVKGIKNQKIDHVNDMGLFQKWARGETGEAFIDANMKELNRTGFMSNRGRQIVASYLVNDLKVNWTWGASYFQSKLIDYDPHSNWGNWNYLAGVGNDPRKDRHFNVKAQAEKYDPRGEFVNRWTEPIFDL